jgi:hypothetical protein
MRIETTLPTQFPPFLANDISFPLITEDCRAFTNAKAIFLPHRRISWTQSWTFRFQDPAIDFDSLLITILSI